MSSDNKFEDPYNISSEEAVGSLEVENTDTIQAEMPSGNENKSICKSLSRHLSLLKSKVSELRTFMDNREAVQNIDDHEIEEIQSMSNWIKAKASKILNQWEDFLETNQDEDELARAEPTYNECEDLSSKIKSRADKFIREKRSRTASAHQLSHQHL